MVATYVICDTCNHTLRKGRLPKLSIANGFAVAALPAEFADTRAIEFLLCAQIHNRMQLLTMDGVGSKVLKGHTLSLASNVALVAEKLLPRGVEAMQSSLRVVVVGARTDQDKVNFRRYHDARPSRIQSLLNFYMTNNHLYADVRLGPARRRPRAATRRR